MPRSDDGRLVDALFEERDERDEQDEQRLTSERAPDAAVRAEVEGLRDTLRTMRRLEHEDPPTHLDALILARAREEAERLAESGMGLGARLSRLLRSPFTGLAAAAMVAGLAAIVLVPSLAPESNRPVPTRLEAFPASVESPPPGALDGAPEAKEEAATDAPRDRDSSREPRAEAPPAPKALRAKSARQAEALPRSEGARSSAGGAALGASPAEKDASGMKADRRRGNVSLDDLVASEAQPEEPSAMKPSTTRPAEPPPAAPRSDAAAPRPPATLEPSSASGSKTKGEAAKKRSSADLSEARVEANERDGARARLLAALERARGSAEEPSLLLRLAEHDFADRRFVNAARLAREAAGFPGFARAKEARDLAARAEKRSRE